MNRHKWPMLAFIVSSIVGVFSVYVDAERGEIFGGVDNDLFLGTWFTAGTDLDLMLTLYESTGLGLGFDYHAKPWQIEVENQQDKLNASMLGENGAFQYCRDEALKTAAGSLTWKMGHWQMGGGLFKPDDGAERGSWNIRADDGVWKTAARWGYRLDDGSESNYRTSIGLGTGSVQWLLDMQCNAFREGENALVGRSAEFGLRSAQDTWLLQAGSFEESDDSPVAAGRYHAAWQGQRQTQLSQGSSIGLKSSLGSYGYTTGDSRWEGTIAGWCRRPTASGYTRLDLQGALRDGITPFDFDRQESKSLYAKAEVDYQKAYHSNFSMSYDLLNVHMRTAKGLLEFPIPEVGLGRVTADYDSSVDYQRSEPVCSLEYEATGKKLIVQQSFNHRLQSLYSRLQWEHPSDQGLWSATAAYDWRVSRLQEISFSLSSPDFGRFGLHYDLVTPRFTLSYTWGNSDARSTLGAVSTKAKGQK